MKKLNKKGFTIIELVIVIAVIAILAAVMIPTFSGIVEKAKESAAQQEATSYFKELYALDLADGNYDGDAAEITKSTESDKTNQVTEIDSVAVTGVTIEYYKDGNDVKFTFEKGDYYYTSTNGAAPTKATKSAE